MDLSVIDVAWGGNLDRNKNAIFSVPSEVKMKSDLFAKEFMGIRAVAKCHDSSIFVLR